MTDTHDQISDVMAFAAKNPDIFSLLVDDTDLARLDLGDDRAAACAAAREHLRALRFPLLRACHAALYREMEGVLAQQKVLRLAVHPYFWVRWTETIYIKFWVWHGDKVVETYEQVPLLVTFSTDKKGTGLDAMASKLRAATGAEPVRLDLWQPRLVWRAVPLTARPFAEIAENAVTGLRSLYLGAAVAPDGEP